MTTAEILISATIQIVINFGAACILAGILLHMAERQEDRPA